MVRKYEKLQFIVLIFCFFGGIEYIICTAIYETATRV